jgi:hypothetical protein
MTVQFISKDPQIEDYWRGIILFGRNVASYKFALAQALLELKPQAGELIKLGDLAPVYAKHISQHLKQADKQATSSSSQFLDACRQYNQNSLTQNELTEQTIRLGFNNVIDAFHKVGNTDVAQRFYNDERKSNQGIRITDAFSKLLLCQQSANLPQEVESRWHLVETAWALNVAQSVLSIGYDHENKTLFALDKKQRRKSVTGSREALSGYQKGKCFYCFSDISIKNQDSDIYPDVDHFFPHILKKHDTQYQSVDGVWNLVLSCITCNRGERGKFAQVPSIKLLERLHRRNEFLIASHHPLRETLIQQTGQKELSRKTFLNNFHNQVLKVLLQIWEAEEKDSPCF